MEKMRSQGHCTAEVVGDHLWCLQLPMPQESRQNLSLNCEVNRVIRMFRRLPVTGHVPQVDGVVLRQRGGRRRPQRRGPGGPVAEHYSGAAATLVPSDGSPAPIEGLRQLMHRTRLAATADTRGSAAPDLPHDLTQ